MSVSVPAVELVVQITGVVRSHQALRPLRVAALTVARGERVAIHGVDAPAAEMLINLVTGGDTDLGCAIAQGFKDAGHRVVITGARRDDLEVNAKELDIDAVTCDPLDPFGLAEAVRRVREAEPAREIEVECRSVDEAAYALGTGAHRLLLDNMRPDELRRAVEARDAAGDANAHQVRLEASGGVTLENVAEIAATGVDSISVGALTHSAPALDLSMLLE